MAGTCVHVEFLRAQPAWALALAAVGLLVALRAAIRLAPWVYAVFLRPGKPLRRCYGATDGIGHAITFRLAGAELGLVLVGCNPEKLPALCCSAETAPSQAWTTAPRRASPSAKSHAVVVVTSSIVPSPGWPAGEVHDERCWTDIDYCEKNRVWYPASKTLAEKAARVVPPVGGGAFPRGIARRWRLGRPGR